MIADTARTSYNILEDGSVNDTEATPRKLTTQQCVEVALNTGAYDALIQSAKRNGGQADCRLLYKGPCSLVGDGPPYFYPGREMSDDLWNALVVAPKPATDRLAQTRLSFEYNPPAHMCEKCPEKFNPLRHSCLVKPFNQGGWADPPDHSVISPSNRQWLASHCQNPKQGMTFPQRAESSWCKTPQFAPQFINGRLKNPAGRTGLVGRGSLGLWGPNKAGDPVIIARGDTLNQHITRGSAALTSDYGGVAFNPKTYYVRLIMRTDVAAVAIPGGMVDPGESGLQAAIREFQEEAMAGGNDGAAAQQLVQQVLASMNPRLVYRGLVDDPRNTDDAWMETEAYMIDISGQDAAGSMKQKVRAKAITGRAGDDAGAVRWLSLTDAARGTLTWVQKRKPLRLRCCYASHYAIIQLALAKLQQPQPPAQLKGQTGQVNIKRRG